MRVGFIFIFMTWQVGILFAQMTPREYFKFAKYHFENKEYSEALKMLDRAIYEDQEYINAYYLRSEVNYYLKNYNSALIDINKVFSLDKKENAYYPDYLLLRGKIYKKLNLVDKALVDFNKSILLSDAKDEAHYERAKIKKTRNNFMGAMTDMNNAIRINPEHADYYAFRSKIKRDFYHPNYNDKKYESILNDINKAISLDSVRFKYYKFRVTLYIESGHKNRALKDLNDMIIKYPNQSFSYSSRGLIRMKDTYYKSAIDDFNKAIVLAPDDEKSFHYRGLCYHNLGAYGLASRDFTKAIDIITLKFEQDKITDHRVKITLGEIYILRGICFQQMGKGSLGCGDFLKANKLGVGKGLFYYKKFCERY